MIVFCYPNIGTILRYKVLSLPILIIFSIISLNNILSKNSVTVTKLARGLPVGGDIDYLDEATLLQAIEGRTSI